MQVFRARYVAPMNRPIIEDGCVVVQAGRILEIGRYQDLKPVKADHLIDGVLMPGLINAHTHLELSDIPRPACPGSFVDWILTISGQIRGDKNTFVQRRIAAVRQGVNQCIRFGVTCVGDISQHMTISRPILREGPIRSVSFGECLGIGERRWRFDELFAQATSDTSDELCRVGISPHAPYTVDREGFDQIRRASARGVPVSVHVSETLDEAAFLLDHSGDLGDLYQRIKTDPGPPMGVAGGAIRFICQSFAPKKWLFAHVNYCDDEDIRLLRDNSGGVVWCPRTHAYFNHPPHRWQEMLASGVTVCVGTDSCASSPDLNLVDDLRLLHKNCPDAPVDLLWQMVTTLADQALHWSREAADDQPTPMPQLGALSAGLRADMVAFATQSDDPLREILETQAMLPSGVWIDGKSVIAAGCA